MAELGNPIGRTCCLRTASRRDSCFAAEAPQPNVPACKDCPNRLNAMWPLWERRLRAYIQRRGIDRHAADEILGEVLVVAWRRLSDVPADPESAVGWLVGVTRRVMSNHWRSEARRAALAARIDKEGFRLSPSDQHAVSTVELVEGWQRLSPPDRLVLVLTGWHGLAVTDLADLLGSTTSAAAKRLVRARRRLRDAVE